MPGPPALGIAWLALDQMRAAMFGALLVLSSGSTDTGNCRSLPSGTSWPATALREAWMPATIVAVFARCASFAVSAVDACRAVVARSANKAWRTTPVDASTSGPFRKQRYD